MPNDQIGVLLTPSEFILVYDALYAARHFVLNSKPNDATLSIVNRAIDCANSKQGYMPCAIKS